VIVTVTGGIETEDVMTGGIVTGDGVRTAKTVTATGVVAAPASGTGVCVCARERERDRDRDRD